ncbi:MAG TPA: AraC family transcriptional regulator [Cyclobacteriaceae bacterium]|jgi:AraC-like DNA-binding protein|nr:AraC family transcriptional regulator [Cyclobacteriaceae bacterium]
MHKENLYQPYQIVYQTLEECPKLEHQHTFFELVFILQGKGKQCINKSSFGYHANHMFLLTPGDCHRFDIEEATTFFFLRFSNIYINDSGFSAKYLKHLEYILQNASHKPGCILKNQTDKVLVRAVVEAIVREHVNQDPYQHELIAQFVDTLIVVVARNIAKYLPLTVSDQTEEKILDILQYIQSNIYQPEKLRAENISKHFGISDTYLGRYFKKHTSETLQQYISNYRITLIENRLKHSDLRINEIAQVMGFTDESHLNKFFRKNKGISPLAYRKTSITK